jgi:hypothetical protein
MSHTIRIHVLTLCLTVLAVPQGFAQPETMPPPIWPGAPRLDGAGPPTAMSATVTPGACTAPPACTPYEDRNGPLLIGDPLLDSSPGTPGLVGAFDLGIVVPHVKNHLASPVTLFNSGVTDTVHLPTADLGVRAMPKLELGYRWGQATGELTLSYRFVDASGGQIVSPADLPAFAPTGTPLRSRLDLQILDLDYGSHEPLTVFGVAMKWRVGVHSMIYYSDSQASNGVLAQQTVNRFWGVGPHVAVDFRYPLRSTGLALFSRIEGAVPFGRVTQRYKEFVPGDAGESRFFFNTETTSLAIQAGIVWSPKANDRFHVTAGYYYEHFWGLGDSFTGIAPREELWLQGGFIRAEWNY